VTKSLARLLLIGFVLIVFGLGVSRVFAWDEDGEIRQLASWVLHEMRRADALQQRHVEVGEAMELKRAATVEFIAGRLSLHETAEQFRAADALVQDNTDGLVASYCSPKTEHGVCLQVEVWVEIALDEGYTSREVEEVRCRLHAELNELFPATDHHLVN